VLIEVGRDCHRALRQFVEGDGVQHNGEAVVEGLHYLRVAKESGDLQQHRESQ
jgi:hypothetical protein